MSSDFGSFEAGGLPSVVMISNYPEQSQTFSRTFVASRGAADTLAGEKVKMKPWEWNRPACLGRPTYVSPSVGTLCGQGGSGRTGSTICVLAQCCASPRSLGRRAPREPQQTSERLLGESPRDVKSGLNVARPGMQIP